MRIVRIDDIAPGGRALELHPQLTVLRGASPELRRRLEAVVRSVSGLEAPPHGGELEVNGVRLVLDAATLERLELDVGCDPVVAVGSSVEAHRGRRMVAPTTPTTLSDVPPEATAQASADQGRLRRELREVGEQLSGIDERMRDVRTQLDPGATNALDAARGRLDVLERRRSTARAEWEAHRARLDASRRALSEAVDELTRRARTIDSLEPGPLDAAARGLSAALDTPLEVDPTAEELAARLESTVERLTAARAGRDDVDRRRLDLIDRLEEARRHADEADSAVRGHGDPVTVRRLEEVRDEIFAAADRGGRLSPRGRRRLQELRAEQAVLLDRLGFDTYSAYVMGIPSVRAEIERSTRAGSAHDQLDELQRELDELGGANARPAEVDRLEAELQTLLVLAHRELGPDDLRAVPLDVGRPGVEELVASTVAALRTPRSTHGAGERVSSARDEVCRAIEVVAVIAERLPLADLDAPPERGTAATTAVELLDLAQRWCDWIAAARATLPALRDEIERRTAERDDLAVDPVSSWAELEAELDLELDRLAELEERVRRHDEATHLLAELREEELELRSRERSLLERVAGSGAPPPPVAPPLPVAPPSPAATTPSAAPSVAATAASDGHALAWELASVLAGLHQVSFVGSVPALLTVGPDGVPGQVRALLERISSLIQLVVLTDDTQLVDWARSLGASARPVEFATLVQ